MAAALLGPAPDNLMEVYEISPEVNRVANDAPSLLERYNAGEAPRSVETPKPASRRRALADTGQGSLF
jgi:hypothetical protein